MKEGPEVSYGVFEMYLDGMEDGTVGMICTHETCMTPGAKFRQNPKGLYYQDVGELPFRPSAMQVSVAWERHLTDKHPGVNP